MRISRRWLAIAIIWTLFIWCNSLTPGEGSSSLSLGVLEMVRGVLDSIGLPSAWIANFLIRKAAHFSEYAILGVLVTRAVDGTYAHRKAQLCGICLALLLVPSIDETIQLFVPGRSGQVSDVLLDCCGAAAGVLASYGIAHLRHVRA